MAGCSKQFTFANCKIYYNLNGIVHHHWQVIDIAVAMEMVSMDPYLAILQYQATYDGNMDQTIVVVTHAL